MMTGRVIPVTATGTTRTTPAVEIMETEIPAITVMETATVRGRATIRRTASPGARMMQATAMQPMRRRTTAEPVRHSLPGTGGSKCC